MTDIEKVIANYCGNLNRIVLYLKGRQSDLKDIEDVKISDSQSSGRISEINVNLDLLRNVERIRGSEILAGIKSQVAEDFVDAATFSKSLMRESLKSNALRRNKEELLNELVELQHMHQYGTEPMGKFIDVINSKLDPSSSSKDSRVYDLKSFADFHTSVASIVEDSIEMLMIKRLAAMESHLPRQCSEQFQQAKHTLGTVMIDYVNKIEELDMLVLSTREQNESLLQKMEDLMKEVRNRRKMETLGQERYMHLSDLLTKQEDMAQREIRLLQEKLEAARNQVGPKMDQITDLQSEYEIVENKDGVEYFIMYPGESLESDLQSVTASLQEDGRSENPKVLLKKRIDGVQPNPIEYCGDEFARERTPQYVPPMLDEIMESSEEQSSYNLLSKDGEAFVHRTNIRLPRRLDTIHSESENVDESQRETPNVRVGVEKSVSTMPRLSDRTSSLGRDSRVLSVTPTVKKQAVKLTPEQLLVRMKQLERERGQGVLMIHRLDAINRKLQKDCMDYNERLEKFQQRETDMISSYNQFYDLNKNLVRDTEVNKTNIVKKQEQMLVELSQLKKADKTTIAQLQNSLNAARIQLDKSTADTKYYRDQCILKDAELRKLYESSQPGSSKDFLNLSKSDEIGNSVGIADSQQKPDSRNSPIKLRVVKEHTPDKQQSKQNWAKSELIDSDAINQKDRNVQGQPKRAGNKETAGRPEVPEDNQRYGSNLEEAERTIAALKEQLRKLNHEKSVLEDENLKLGNKCVTFDNVLESLTSNQDKELPYIYVKGKKRTGDEIFSLLQTNDQLLKKKDEEIEKLQKLYAKAENSYEDIEKRFRRLQAEKGQAQGQRQAIGVNQQAKSNQVSSGLVMLKPTGGQIMQRNEKSGYQQSSTGGEPIKAYFPPQPSGGQEQQVHHGELHRLDSHSHAYYPPEPEDGMERLNEDARMISQPRVTVPGQYPIVPEGEEQYSSQTQYQHSRIQGQFPILPEGEEQNFTQQTYQPDRVQGQYPVLPEGEEQYSSQQNYAPARIQGQFPVPPEEGEQYSLQHHSSKPHLDTHLLPFIPPMPGQTSERNQETYARTFPAMQPGSNYVQNQHPDLKKIPVLESRIRELTSDKKSIEEERQKLQASFLQLGSIKDKLDRELKASEARVETLELRLTAADDRNEAQETENNLIKKEIEGLRVINSQIVIESERKQQAEIESSSPINRARATLANHPSANQVTLLDEDSIEELVLTVGRENEELKDKMRKLEINNQRLSQEKELTLSTLKGKEAKINELTSEINNKESKLKNLTEQYNKAMSQAADSAQIVNSPKNKTSIGLDAIEININERQLIELIRLGEDKDILIAELRLTIEELKEELDEKDKALEDVRRTLAALYAKKQHLVNLLLSVKQDFYIEGHPVKSLNEKSLDKILEENLQKKSAAHTARVYNVPTKQTLNVISVKAPRITHDNLLSSDGAPPGSLNSVGQLNREVMRLGEENTRLQQALMKYLEREESLKGKVLSIIDHNINIDPDDRATYQEFKEGIDILDDETIEEYFVPLDYGKLFEFLDFLNKIRAKMPHPSLVEDTNQEVYNYEEPTDYSREDDLLLQVLQRNEECQRQIKRLLSEKVSQNKAIILRAPSNSFKESNPKAAKKEEHRREHLQKVTESLEEFVNH